MGFPSFHSAPKGLSEQHNAMSGLSLLWTLPACRDTATLRLEHSNWFCSQWQQTHNCGEQLAENTASHRNCSLTYDDLTWNTSKGLSTWNILVLSDEAPTGAQPLGTCWGFHSVLLRKEDSMQYFTCKCFPFIHWPLAAWLYWWDLPIRCSPYRSFCCSIRKTQC